MIGLRCVIVASICTEHPEIESTLHLCIYAVHVCLLKVAARVSCHDRTGLPRDVSSFFAPDKSKVAVGRYIRRHFNIVLDRLPNKLARWVRSGMQVAWMQVMVDI
jgi:hypothetical protein